MKKTAALLLAVLLLLPMAAMAESEKLTNADGLVYILAGDGTAEIVATPARRRR